MPQLAYNKRAKFDYEILETFEAGLALTGQEVKSARDGKMSLIGSYVTMHGGEAFLLNAQIAKYRFAGKLEGYDPKRSRKLLLRKQELSRILGKLEQKGLTLVPVSVYTKGSKVKLEFGVGRGKKQYEKKEKIKSRDIERDVRREISE